MLSSVTEALCKTVHADVILRAHLHWYRHVDVEKKHIILCPAWQLITPWAVKSMGYYGAAWKSSLGAVLISITGESGVDGLRVRPYLFTLPHEDVRAL
jgi:hypothetical protein